MAIYSILGSLRSRRIRDHKRQDRVRAGVCVHTREKIPAWWSQAPPKISLSHQNSSKGLERTATDFSSGKCNKTRVRHFGAGKCATFFLFIFRMPCWRWQRERRKNLMKISFWYRTMPNALRVTSFSGWWKQKTVKIIVKNKILV